MLSEIIGALVIPRLYLIPSLYTDTKWVLAHIIELDCHIFSLCVQSAVVTSDGNRFQFPKSIIGNKSNSILELESVSWCADCGI